MAGIESHPRHDITDALRHQSQAFHEELDQEMRRNPSPRREAASTAPQVLDLSSDIYNCGNQPRQQEVHAAPREFHPTPASAPGPAEPTVSIGATILEKAPSPIDVGGYVAQLASAAIKHVPSQMSLGFAGNFAGPVMSFSISMHQADQLELQGKTTEARANRYAAVASSAMSLGMGLKFGPTAGFLAGQATNFVMMQPINHPEWNHTILMGTGN